MSADLLPVAEEIVHGRRVRVARLGAGPPVVLLHGYPDTLQVWARVARALSGRFEIRAPDWPGMGRSEAWPGGATPFDLADRVAALLDHWGLASAAVVGMDMGGQPALVLAARHPTRVRAAVVLNSLLMGDEPTSWEIRVLRRFRWNRWLIRNAPALVFARAVRTSLPAGEGLPTGIRDDFRTAFAQRTARDFISRMCAGYQGTLPLLPEHYARITCPVLALWGGRDRHFPVRHAERLAQIVPGARVTVIPDGEHWMAWHRADAVADAIQAFLS